MKHVTIRGVAFHANDEEKHDVYYSHVSKNWVVENEKKGLVYQSPYLCSALTNMHLATTRGKDNSGTNYADAVPNNWTMTDNPYAAKDVIEVSKKRLGIVTKS